MKHFRIIILIMLALHLLAINTNLLINLTTYFKNDQQSFQIGMAILFSLSYSLGNVYTLNRKGFVWLKVLFTIMDGLAVFIWYNSMIKEMDYVYITSTFYAAYTVIVALGVGIRDKVKTTNPDELKHNKLFVYGYLSYLKWRFRKSKNDRLLAIANEFELLIDNNDVDFDKETITNLEDIKKEVTKIINKK